MKENWTVSRTIGSGSFIEVYNLVGLNTVAQYRFRIPVKTHIKELVGIWKQKKI
jgi:hypothetical protein